MEEKIFLDRIVSPLQLSKYDLLITLSINNELLTYLSPNIITDNNSIVITKLTYYKTPCVYLYLGEYKVGMPFTPETTAIKILYKSKQLWTSLDNVYKIR